MSNIDIKEETIMNSSIVTNVKWTFKCVYVDDNYIYIGGSPNLVLIYDKIAKKPVD
jgi:hypothetical protein